MRAIARRFGYGSLAALAVLVATGWAMAAHYDLFGELDPALEAGPGRPRRSRSPSSTCARPRLHALQAAILLASLAIVWLGLELAG